MEKRISPWLILGMIIILGGVFTYTTYDSINRKKEHLRKILISRGEATIDSFETALREISREDKRKNFWIKRLLIETSKLPAVRFIFISSPEGMILARGNKLDVDFKNLGKIAKLKKPNQETSWELLKGSEENTLLIYRKLSPSLIPGLKKRRPLKRHHGHKAKHGGISEEAPPDVFFKFFFKENQTLHYTPKDLGIFLGVDTDVALEMAQQAGIQDYGKTIATGFILFLFTSGGILLLFFFHNYRSASISLGRAKKFSNALIEAMPTGFITTNMDGKILSSNRAARLIFESDDEIDQLPGEIDGLIKEINKNSLVHKAVNKEIIIQTKGLKKNLDLNISYIPEGINERPGILILIKDETEKNLLKKEIALNERLVTVGKLAAGVAHEIRNPLSSIKGFSTCINQSPENLDQTTSITKLIINEVDRLDKVVGQLLDFSKPLHLIKEDTDIKNLIDESLKIISAGQENKKIEVFNNLEENFKLYIDRDKIKQVLLNLLYNSVEALGSEGTIEINQQTQNNMLRLSIKDSGSGIKEEIMPHIFDPYYTTKSTGTGLGLAISRNIIFAHNGEIHAKADKDGKTLFYIDLPVEK